ncbi:hypothetical protein MHYP_G00090330 [Metynnis hypsauchen]
MIKVIRPSGIQAAGLRETKKQQQWLLSSVKCVRIRSEACFPASGACVAAEASADPALRLHRPAVAPSGGFGCQHHSDISLSGGMCSLRRWEPVSDNLDPHITPACLVI